MTRQYIGARYVIKFYKNSADPSSTEWESGVGFEALTLVTYNYSSYVSRMPVPPSIGNPADNPNYWALTGAYNGQIASLENRVNALTNICDILENMKNGFVSSDNFTSLNDAVEFARDNHIKLIILGKDEVISSPVGLYDNMILDGAGHRLDCSDDFVGTRAITNHNSGYWNDDRTIYAPYFVNIAINYNITVKNLVLGEFHRSNHNGAGEEIGVNSVPRNWLAFDSIDGLTIENVVSDDFTSVESYIWNTQAKNVTIKNCRLESTGYHGTGGIFWQYTRFDNSPEYVNSNHNVTVKDCVFKCSTDEAIALRSYEVGNIKHALIENVDIKSSSGQGITIDANQGTPDDITIKDCSFFNCGARCTTRAKRFNVVGCCFKSDSDNVSNQGYFLRALANSAINITNTEMEIIVDNCSFDEFNNYYGAIFFDIVNCAKITNCVFKAKGANTSVGVDLKDNRNTLVSQNTFMNFDTAIALETSSTDFDCTQKISNNNAYMCDKFIDIPARMRYTTVEHNSLAKCNYGIKYHGVQFLDNMVNGNYAEELKVFLYMPTGTPSSNGITLVTNNLIVDDQANDLMFFTDDITFGALHFLNNYWQSFGAGYLRLYPNTVQQPT